MSDNIKDTPIEELAANILNTRFENFDKATLDNAKSRIIDVVGCSIGGANAAGNSALIDIVRDWGGKQEATILAYGGKIPAHNAAMVNSIMARSFDFEALVPQIIDRGQDEIRQLLEMLVRAYDPCISCSTHYLDVQFR